MYKPLTAILAPVLLLSACGDDFESLPEARFAELSPAQQKAAITASLGFPALYGKLIAGSLDSDSSCPARVVSGDTVTYNADVGCTAASGQTYAGRLRVTGSLASGPYQIHFDHFRAGGFLFSGDLSLSAVVAEDGFARLHEELLFEINEEPVRISSLALCDAEGRCHTEERARGALPGVAQFDLAFVRQTLDGAPSGELVLTGADTLELVLTRERDLAGCSPYTIDGLVAGSWCGVGR